MTTDKIYSIERIDYNRIDKDIRVGFVTGENLEKTIKSLLSKEPDIFGLYLDEWKLERAIKDYGKFEIRIDFTRLYLVIKEFNLIK